MALLILLFDISSSVSFSHTLARITRILEFLCPAQKPSVVLQQIIIKEIIEVDKKPSKALLGFIFDVYNNLT